MNLIHVSLGSRSYPIYIGPSARVALAECGAGAEGDTQVAVIADETVASLHGQRLEPLLNLGHIVITFPPGERSKTLEQVEALHRRLAAARVERHAVIVTFGGGVAGDLGGFVAATWLRGVRCIHMPTTLLAAVDAAVGGKTGVNLPEGKNLVGVFHQPAAVIVDTDFLDTLPARDFTAGLAESVKQAIVRDAEFLAWHEATAAAVCGRDPAALAHLITRNCELKADIVAQDEREAGLRAILNYGHTIGHAIERLLGYELRHGECVALGMLVENEVARARGLLAPSEADRIRDLIARLGLPLQVPRPLDAPDFAAACRADKKVRGGAVNFVLIRGIGAPVRVADVTPAEIAAALTAIQ
jgi:3-dehydroquinate synthase